MPNVCVDCARLRHRSHSRFGDHCKDGSNRATRSINATYREESFSVNIRGAHHSFVLCRYAPVTSQWGHDDPRSSLDRIRDVSGNTDAAKVKGSKSRILIYELPEVQPDRRNAAAASVCATRSINAVYCEESFFANIRGAHHSFVLSRYAPVTSQW